MKLGVEAVRKTDDHKDTKGTKDTKMSGKTTGTEMTVELIQPIAMEEGLRFAIREGGRTVGAGTVTKILK